MTDEITITKDGVTVTVFTTKVEEIIEKKLTVLRIPVVKQNWAIDPKISIIDLKIVTHTFSIDGHLSATSVYTAAQQRENLRTIIQSGGTAVFVYGTITANVNFNKVAFTEVPMDESTPSYYDVSMGLEIGENR